MMKMTATLELDSASIMPLVTPLSGPLARRYITVARLMLDSFATLLTAVVNSCYDIIIALSLPKAATCLLLTRLAHVPTCLVCITLVRVTLMDSHLLRDQAPLALSLAPASHPVFALSILIAQDPWPT